MRNLILKAEIIRRYGSQLHFARAANIQELRISKIIHGRTRPTAAEIITMARLLKMDHTELFPIEDNLKSSINSGLSTEV